MRVKYIVRERGGDVRLGLYYVPPDPDNGEAGHVVAGGPARFEDAVLGILGVFAPERAMKVETLSETGSKARWRLKRVEVGEWKDGLRKLREQGYSLERVRKFKGLMW